LLAERVCKFWLLITIVDNKQYIWSRKAWQCCLRIDVAFAFTNGELAQQKVIGRRTPVFRSRGDGLCERSQIRQGMGSSGGNIHTHRHVGLDAALASRSDVLGVTQERIDEII
jgi:hypothetical protein